MEHHIYYVGLDLHSNNVCCVITDQSDRRVYRRRLNNKVKDILCALSPYQGSISGVAIESTFNWYWLVDSLMEAGYRVQLVHVAAIESYRGKKRTNDFDDAYNLARLLRKGELPPAYIYPREERPFRDLLRKRWLLVKTRTQHLLNFNNLVSRNTGQGVSGNKAKGLSDEELKDMFDHHYLVLSGQVSLSVVKHLSEQIQRLEKAILKIGRIKPEFNKLLTIPGIGKILALTIAFEAGGLSRFPDVGNYLSYCRCVDSQRISNGKKKGENNRKCGNKYLCWAYIEAAAFARRFCPYARAYYNFKLKETGYTVVAAKALASKIARASFVVMTTDVDYDPEKVFGRFKAQAQALILKRPGKPKKIKPGRDSQPARRLDTNSNGEPLD
jgi:transposase